MKALHRSQHKEKEDVHVLDMFDAGKKGRSGYET